MNELSGYFSVFPFVHAMLKTIRSRSRSLQALYAAGASTAKERAAARLWETEARKYGELIAYMEERERQLQAELSRSVPLEEHRRIVDELKRIRGEAEGVARERAEVGRELTSQIKVRDVWGRSGEGKGANAEL